MSRRLLAFALAFVVIAVPVAADVCEAVCGEHAGHSIDQLVSESHQHPDGQRSHHHAGALTAQAAPSAALKPPPHRCGRLDAVVTESRDLRVSHIDNTTVTRAHFTPLFVHVWPTSAVDSRHGPPAPTRSTSPLRI
jgi:hypothetical protein